MIRLFALSLVFLLPAISIFGYAAIFILLMATFPSQGEKDVDFWINLMILSGIWLLALCCFGWFFLRWFIKGVKRVRAKKDNIESVFE